MSDQDKYAYLVLGGYKPWTCSAGERGGCASYVYGAHWRDPQGQVMTNQDVRQVLYDN
jgi:hypothetical protein